MSFGKPLIIDSDGVEFNGTRIKVSEFNVRLEGYRTMLYFNGVDGEISTGSKSFDRLIVKIIGMINSGIPFNDVEKLHKDMMKSHNWFLIYCAMAVIVGGGIAGVTMKFEMLILPIIGVIAAAIWYGKRCKELL